MKKLLLLFSFCPYFLMGQFEINFENGIAAYAEQYPPERWSVGYENSLEGDASLIHSFDNPENGVDCISFFHQKTDFTEPVSWSFLLKYNYKPSASNNWAVFFLSENAASMLNDPQNDALVLGVNQSGSDDSLRLYRYQNGSYKTLCSAGLNWQEDVGQEAFRLRIRIRDDSLFLEGNHPSLSSEILLRMKMDKKDLPEGQNFGLCYRYTSSKDRLLSFDDLHIDGKFVTDSTGPELIEIGFPSEHSLQFVFDEDILTPENFSLEMKPKPDSFKTDNNMLILYFSGDLENEKSYDLSVKNITDRNRNSSVINKTFTFYYPQRHDIIINEMLYDPTPTVYLPEYDFVELKNRTNHKINLKGWTLKTERTTWEIPECSIDSTGYMVFSGQEVLYDPGYTKADGAENFMNNSGAEIFLYDANEKLIDAVYYCGDWYSESFKSDGGWSLERIDPGNLCAGKLNWKFSESPEGGTPGRMNSFTGKVEDDQPPVLSRLIFKDSSSFLLRFSESLDPETDPDRDLLMEAEGNRIDTIFFSNPFNDELILNFNTVMQFPFSLGFNGNLRDCASNEFYCRESRMIMPPSHPEAADVLISEVLFAPSPGCPEYIELYNASGKIISLDDLRVTFSDHPFSEPPEETLMNEKGLFFPGEYLVISAGPDVLYDYFDVLFPGRMLKFPSICKLPDSGGRIVLYNRSGTIIDEMHYDMDAHFPMLIDYHGVSLERIRLDENMGYLSDWHSASSLSGFGTPGYENSQALDLSTESSSAFSVEEELFTPDNDGNNDYAIFTYRMEEEGYVGTLRIFDATGRLVCTPGSNELLGTEGRMLWDGRNHDGRLCPTGIYLGFFEVFHLSGKKKKFKEAVVLSRGRL